MLRPVAGTGMGQGIRTVLHQLEQLTVCIAPMCGVVLLVGVFDNHIQLRPVSVKGFLLPELRTGRCSLPALTIASSTLDVGLGKFASSR